MLRRLAVMLFVLLLSLALVGPAEAHANLARSEPAAGALLDAAPGELVLEFTEELDPGFSTIELFDSKNQIINPGPGTIDPATPHVLRLALAELPKDSYTAIWKVRSAVDGHITRGSLPFGVGVEVNATSLIPPPGSPDPATLTPPPLDSAARWLNLLAAALALGGLPFAVLVWRPAFKATDHRPPTTDHRQLRTENQDPTTDHRPPTTDEAILAASGGPVQSTTVLVEPAPVVVSELVEGEPVARPDEARDLQAADGAMAGVLRRLVLIGGVLFILTNLFFLVVQAATAADVSLVQAFGAPLLQMLSGRSGLLLLVRVALIFQIVFLSWRLPAPGRGVPLLWWATLAIGGVALLTISLNSHGAAATQAAAWARPEIAVVFDWLHLAAMVAWLGGLIPLAFAIGAAWRTPERALPLAALIPRFSWLAGISVAILTLTGIYSYILHINGLDLLAATTYGRALIVKLALFGVLLLFGGLNLFILSRRLRASRGGPAGAFRRSVRAELVAGVLLLGAVGAMTSVAPSKSAWEAHEQLGIAQEAREGDVDLVLRIAPAQIGDNEFAVDVTDRRPGAQAATSKMLLNFDMVGMEMGQLQTEARPSDSDFERYTARGNFVGMGGRWQIEVVLRRAGFDDVRHTFEVDILRSAALSP